MNPMIWVVWKLCNHTKTPLSMPFLYIIPHICFFVSESFCEQYQSISVSCASRPASHLGNLLFGSLVLSVQVLSISWLLRVRLERIQLSNYMHEPRLLSHKLVVALWSQSPFTSQLVGVSLIFVSSAQAFENVTEHLYAATSGGSFGPATFVAGRDRQRDVKMGVCIVMEPKLVAYG